MNQPTLFPRQKQQIAPGAVHLPNWLSLEAQRELLAQCREWAKPPSGLYTPRMLNGQPLSVRVVCLGWHWYPYSYSKTRDDSDCLPCKPFPPELDRLTRLALEATLLDDQAQFQPDVAIVNWYSASAKLGMHQDRSESERVREAGSPIISISLGDALLMVKPSYFGVGYLSQERWENLWQQSLRVDYKPICHVRAIAKQHSPTVIVPEILKYQCKASDLVANREWFLELTRQLHKTRAVSVGGVLRGYMKALEQEPEDLIGEDEKGEIVDEGHLFFGWRREQKKYKLVE